QAHRGARDRRHALCRRQMEGSLVLRRRARADAAAQCAAYAGSVGLARAMRRAQLALLRLEVGRPNHLGPLLRFLSDQLSKVGGRALQRDPAKISKPRAQLGIGKARIDLLVELLDDVSGSALWRADAIPGT